MFARAARVSTGSQCCEVEEALGLQGHRAPRKFGLSIGHNKVYESSLDSKRLNGKAISSSSSVSSHRRAGLDVGGTVIKGL